jgi:hypothetical protein
MGESRTLNWTVLYHGSPIARIASMAAPGRAEEGEHVRVVEVLEPLRDAPVGAPAFSGYVHLLARNGVAVAQVDEPLWGTGNWKVGDRIVAVYTLELPGSLAPGVYTLAVGGYALRVPPPGIDSLGIVGGDGAPLVGGAGIGLVVPPPAPPPPQHAAEVHYGQGIWSVGYDLALNGRTLRVTVHWETGAKVGTDYTVYVHVVDGAGKLVAQADGQPAGGAAPVSTWVVGEEIADMHQIELPVGLGAGRYTVRWGLYDLATMQEVPVVAGTPEAVLELPEGALVE